MRVGLTFDLRSEYLAAGYSEVETAEFDQPATIDAITAALGRLGFEVDQVGSARRLIARLTAGDRWDLVFNVCEGLHGFGRESLVPALLDAWQIPYVFSDPLACAVTLHKGVAKHIIRGHGLPTPDFVVVDAAEDLRGLTFGFPVFAKPVAEGTGKGVSSASKAASLEELSLVTRRLLDQYRQPVIVEAFLPGREFTVGLIGTGSAARAIGTMEVHLGPKADPGIYTFDNKEHWEGRVTYSLLQEEPLRAQIEELAVRCWRALGCRDGGRLDFRLDEAGNPSFLEANPLAGLHPGHSDLPFICRFMAIPYDELIRGIVASALSRAGLSAPVEPLPQQ